jgi:hypothetical protein
MFIAGRRLFTGQGIVDSQYSTNNETAIRYIVGIASRPFFDKPVHNQWSDLQRFLTGSRSPGIASL